jgi:hypothetical protein
MVKKADITSEPVFKSQFDTHNLNPQKKYVWVLRNDDEQMNDCFAKGYSPATGDEKIMRNPFESTKDEPGSIKVRGTGASERILMSCPKHLAKEREKERATRYVKADKAGKADARKMMAEGGSGFTIENESSEETKTEKLDE